ncbi:CBS domain-containing protein [Archangium lansingense]|uniref:CBS domain-containing protein n=1 Tax=Archangium lansingense TaxID=2995310 RepID=A0ABT4A5L9_9BACT|nr:CBS domain-containing protein [Archangium lansinium]MCY1076925.1 CBS domain-containing protein [Archangium lansinium]
MTPLQRVSKLADMKGHARNLMTTPVKFVSLGTPLSKIAILLAEERISGVPVTDDEAHVLGIISEVDIMNALLKGLPLRTPVEDVMTSPVHMVDEFDLTDEVMELFRKHRIHHLPVVREKKLLGMITPGDVIRFLAEDIPETGRMA